MNRHYNPLTDPSMTDRDWQRLEEANRARLESSNARDRVFHHPGCKESIHTGPMKRGWYVDTRHNGLDVPTQIGPFLTELEAYERSIQYVRTGK